jgi:ABC-type multidrug transport system fused ATPase/permease subunit
MMAGMFIVAFTLAPLLALLMLAAVVFFLAILLVFFNKVIGLYDASRSLYAKTLAKVTEFIQGMEILRVFNRAAWARESLAQAAHCEHSGYVIDIARQISFALAVSQP